MGNAVKTQSLQQGTGSYKAKAQGWDLPDFTAKV